MTDSSALCPICFATIPSSLLEWHADNHFQDEIISLVPPAQNTPSWHPQDYQFNDLIIQQDFELARELAFAPLSPIPPKTNIRANDGESTHSITRTISSSDEDTGLASRISHLTSFQIKDECHLVQDGLMLLLKNCLEAENDSSTSILCCNIDHYESIGSVDRGWGCGWRNIQMLSSHLLMEREEARSVLFGNAGFVPNIASMQRWLEIAWKTGFDTLGSDQFENKIIGSRKWIGTTECATLFRSFGLRARIVDFGPKESKSLYLSVPSTSEGTLQTKIHNRGKRKPVDVCGPMDRFVCRKDKKVPCKGYNGNDISNQFDEDAAGSRGKNGFEKMKAKGQQILFDWIWNYFADDVASNSNGPRVTISRKTPLYFQHDGHSRTIVGVQVKPQNGGTGNCSLLMLDPSNSTAALEKALNKNTGWQRLIKRGVHTLKKAQYQLCYIDPGVAYGEELEKLKVLDSIFFDI
ncbi:unnamed protein product [Rhodiola kirilowii]